MRFAASLAALAALALGGCAEPQLLEPFGSHPPDDVDFTGTWLLREGESASQRSINRAVDQAGGRNDEPSQNSRGRGRSSRGGTKGLVLVFFESGKLLKVTQTPDGFFVSVDRSVVEEFRFGEARIVTVGEIQAQRVSGWVGPVYVVETLDKNNMKLAERWWLEGNGTVLYREISFRGGDGKSATVMQFFDRAGTGRID